MNLQEAAAHFHITTDSLEEFTRKNLDRINRDGEIHALEIQGQWAYDGTAIDIIEELKGLHVDTAEEIATAANSSEKKAESLQAQLTTALAEMTQTALALVDAERRNSAQQAELATLRERTKIQAEQIAKLEATKARLEKQALESIQYQADLKAERALLQEKINRERNKPWWKRIFPGSS